MIDNYNKLIDKLDGFIRRYYYNLLLKGSLLFSAGFLLVFLIFIFLEYFGYFNQGTRFFLFYGFLLFNAVVLVKYILIPFAGLIRIGKRISTSEAGRLLGIHFKNEVNDKITNALELKRYMDENPGESELIMAGIEQKAAAVSQVPFSKAINLRKNFRFLPFLIVPFILITAFILISPSFIIEPAQRIVQYDKHFEKPSPFQFKMINPAKAYKNEGLTIEMKSIGDVVPAEAVLHLGNKSFKMESKEKGVFTYPLKNIQNSLELFVEASAYTFGPFYVEVLQKPLIFEFTVKVDPPRYTRLESEVHNNIGDIIVPVGSDISWEFNTRGTGQIQFFSGDSAKEIKNIGSGLYRVKQKINESFEYQVYAYNQEAGRGDSLKFMVQASPDAYPRIEVEEYRDPVMIAHVFQQGIISDDYGFHKLEFNYRLSSSGNIEDDNKEKFIKQDISLEKGISSQEFFHHFDLSSLDVQPGDRIEYFFKVWDNDGYNGPKATRSNMYVFNVPGLEEQLAEQSETNEQIKKQLNENIEGAQEARSEIEDLKRQLLDSQGLNWEQKEAVKNLLEKQQIVRENMENLNQEKRESELRNEQFNEVDERIQKKQEELSKLFDEIFSEELKELFDKIREELDKLSKEQVYEMLDQMDFEFQDMEMQMDRALELFKQLEMERLLQESIENLDQLSQELGELNEQTNEQADNKTLGLEQENINQDFENIRKSLEEFREKNETLSQPFPVDNTSQQEENISGELDQSLENIMQNNPGQAGKHQKQGQQDMKQLSMRLQNLQQNMFQDRLAEDARNLRQILENLIKTSFAQEELMIDIREVNVNDPRYIQMIKNQHKIKDDLVMIEDSLVALSKRQIQIQGFVTREIAEINHNMDKAVDDLVNRRRYQASSRQQFVMTHINNLSLLLNESLQNMQNQMAMQQGMGQSQQPSQGKPSFKSMGQMQQELNKMLEQLQKGHQPKGGESGKQMGMSEQLARMAAEQEAIRNKLQKLSEELKKEGHDFGNSLQEIQKDMERTELDIVNKRISRQTILRQERILSRLLEHEKAELEREKEERREANTAENYDISNPAELFEYNRRKNNELEMLKRLPPGLNPYYRSLVEKYFLNVE